MLASTGMQGVLLAQTVGSTPGSSAFVLAVLLGLAAFLPFVVLVGTSFVKIVVVFSLLRNALGVPQVPNNMVVMGLAAILSLHIMAPTGAAVLEAAGPLVSQALTQDVSTPQGLETLGRAWAAARGPAARFLRANAKPRDRALFLDLARRARTNQGATHAAMPAADDLSVLLPAFLVSELTAAFVIGFLLFLPFLVVDLVVASLLTALGMASVSPTTVALPFKLLLFVLADGWYLLARALVLGYR